MTSAKATSTYISDSSVLSWDEDRSITTTPRLTPAAVKFSLPALKSSIATSYLMSYLPDGNATYIMTDVVTCDAVAEGEAEDGVKPMGGKEGGSFFTQGKGIYDGTAMFVKGDFVVVSGSGTGSMAGVEGKGSFVTKPTESNKMNTEFIFELSFPKA